MHDYLRCQQEEAEDADRPVNAKTDQSIDKKHQVIVIEDIEDIDETATVGQQNVVTIMRMVVSHSRRYWLTTKLFFKQ